MKRATAFEFIARTFELHMLANNLDDIGIGNDLINDGIVTHGKKRISS